MSAEARAQETASTRIQEWKQGAAAAQKIELGAAAAQSWLVAAALGPRAAAAQAQGITEVRVLLVTKQDQSFSEPFHFCA